MCDKRPGQTSKLHVSGRDFLSTKRALSKWMATTSKEMEPTSDEKVPKRGATSRASSSPVTRVTKKIVSKSNNG